MVFSETQTPNNYTSNSSENPVDLEFLEEIADFYEKIEKNANTSKKNV